MSSTWELLIADWLARAPTAATPRRSPIARLPGRASAVIGMRRAGKTWLVLGDLAQRVASGVAREHQLYLSFEDERLADVQARALGGLLEAWWRRVPDASTSPCHLALDEVQNVPGWERFVRRVLDRGGIEVTVTGSSARLLSREIATSLRGRAVTSEVLPFSVDELIRHRGGTLPVAWPPAEGERARLQRAVDDYLDSGGFPEVVGLPEPERHRVLRDYVDVVLLRDVVERYRAANVVALRRVVRRLASSPASTFSVHRLHNDLKSQGIPVGKDTLHEYLAHVEDAFLAFRVPMFSTSERQRAVNPVKSYVIDTGLARAFAARLEPGHLLENAVYLELRRRGGEVAWYRTASGHEVDFVVQRGATMLLAQVCVDPSEPGTRERELRALDEAMSELGLREATLVTRLHSEEADTSAGVVHMVPAWRWLIEGVA